MKFCEYVFVFSPWLDGDMLGGGGWDGIQGHVNDLELPVNH